jgi:hypothetical protein
MKKVKNFDYKYNNAPMGSLTNSLIDLALTQVGTKLQSDPEQKELAVATITDTVKTGILNNKGLLITGLIIFGVAMGVSNAIISQSISGGR